MENKILVFGEVLFDLFEEKAEIGGAPFNFAAHFTALGGKAALVSAVGTDNLGQSALEELSAKKIDRHYVAKIDAPTGYCSVTLENSIPSYNLAENVAYDHIPLPSVKENYDALYFGTLAQRSAESRNTLMDLLKSDYKEIFYDINIRKPFYTREILDESIQKATILKISREEASVLLPYTSPENYCREVLTRYPTLKQIILTLDKEGSAVLDRTEGIFFSPRPLSKPVSTVGAGDSFGACYLYHRLKGDSIPVCLECATLLSDYVVTKLGAVPALTDELRKKIL